MEQPEEDSLIHATVDVMLDYYGGDCSFSPRDRDFVVGEVRRRTQEQPMPVEEGA